MARVPLQARSRFKRALLYRDNKEFQLAEKCFQQALELHGDYLDATFCLAELKQGRGDHQEAERLYRRAIEIDPDFSMAYNNLAAVYFDQGMTERALKWYMEGCTRDPLNYKVFSNYIMASHYAEEFDASVLKSFAENHHFPIKSTPPPTGKCRPNRPLKVGYVSPDFGFHPVSIFAHPVIARHDRNKVRVYCYSTKPGKNNSFADAFRRLSDEWRECSAIQELAEQIRIDELDVLVDMSGHTANNNLQIFAYRLAPVQLSWPGYFGTTGLDTMDYLLADPVVAPIEEDEHYTEKVVRLPNSYLCFHPPQPWIDPGNPPLEKNGFVTFGCFSNRVKISATNIAVFARILEAVPNSRLLFKYKCYNSEAVRSGLIEAFASHGIGTGRLEFEDKSKYPAYQGAFNRIDIALDTMPFTGGTTMAFSLWMGVPMVTLRGDRWAGRISSSVAIAGGCSDLICADEQEFVQKAVALAGDFQSLQESRKSLRAQLLSSSLCDVSGFVRELENVFLQCYEEKQGSAR